MNIAEEVVEHARRKYGDHPRLSFEIGTCSEIPLDDASVDLVVSFETLEHHGEHDQMLREVKRVLRPGGTLVISTPDRLYYTILPKASNPYHHKELFKEEFRSLLQSYFSRVDLFEQKICHASVMIQGAGRRIAEFRHYLGGFGQVGHTKGIVGPLINLAVATDGEAELAANVSLFEGMEIPTDLDKQLAEANRSNGELPPGSTGSSSTVRTWRRPIGGIWSSKRSASRVDWRRSRSTMPGCGRDSPRSTPDWIAAARSRSRRCAELQSIEGSRAWRLALRFRRYVGTLRKVRDSLWARPQLQR